jgi:hypothetical protein
VASSASSTEVSVASATTPRTHNLQQPLLATVQLIPGLIAALEGKQLQRYALSVDSLLELEPMLFLLVLIAFLFAVILFVLLLID